MSTFRGIVAEFPQIRIDYFRQQAGHKAPLAYFLSHVHSDHLAGLESCRAPFVYCSAATREILLRLEKYHYRINFAKGLLESRNVTYDKSMRKLAKPLPLDTPTTIELAPGNKIRVTLFDANHCVGAVMFLIEGDGKAILYTGDIRAETWWVNSLVQNPVLLPYTLGDRRLDCLYLDTTFATKSEPYREFPSKAEGIRELLAKVSEHPQDTIFYFHSWTFGYENVWIALSAFLNSRIHLDDYRARIYGSLSTLERKQLREIGLDVLVDNKSLRESGLEIREAPALCGFRNGNHIQRGCLTSREGVRIHSCERGMGCRVIDRDTDAKVVHIIPIITRANGDEIAELGAGGGKGDLDQKEELETGDTADAAKLMGLCAEFIEDEELLSKVSALLQPTINGKLDLATMQIQKESRGSQDALSIQALVSILTSNASKDQATEQPRNTTIRFPYSRHSSYLELCGLVEALKPMDVYPCTVDEDNWTPAASMRELFGTLCSRHIFRHDAEMMDLYETNLANRGERKQQEETQKDTQATDEGLNASLVGSKSLRVENTAQLSAEELESHDFVTQRMTMNGAKENITQTRRVESLRAYTTSIATDLNPLTTAPSLQTPAARIVLEKELPEPTSAETVSLSSLAPSTSKSSASGAMDERPSPNGRKRKRQRFTNRAIAYQAAIGTHGLTWSDYGGLISTRSKADQEEQEI
ncbi:Nn.00g073550.m01.CDS01 [Neocucurbitaria sp. VM-36]